MAIRTTSSAVQGIIEHDANISLTPFIEVASNLVDRICDTTNTEYTSTTLELIERWLSAHFYAIRDQQPASEGAGSVNQSFQHRVDLGLNFTRYGQMAMLIDTEGGLAALNKATVEEGGKTKIGITWLGQEDQQDEED